MRRKTEQSGGTEDAHAQEDFYNAVENSGLQLEGLPENAKGRQLRQGMKEKGKSLENFESWIRPHLKAHLPLQSL